MGKRLISSALMFVALSVPSLSHAQFIQYNYDAKTVKAVGENVAAQIAIETVHNEELEKVSKKKKAIAEFSTALSAMKTAYKYSMQNVKGFGEETRIYKAVFETTTDIVSLYPTALQSLSRKAYYSVMCYAEIAGLIAETSGCINTFVNIVNNGKVSFKKSSLLSVAGTTDGYNYLNRSDRYVMANDVLTKLREIKYRLEGIVLMCRYNNGLHDLIYSLTPETWLTILTAQSQTETILNLYKTL